MTNYRNNKKFIYVFFICIFFSIILLLSINIFLSQNNNKHIYDNSIVNFEDSKKNKFKYSSSSLYIEGPAKFLSYEEARKEINYELFSKIIDITIKYNVNNILDFQYYINSNKKYVQFSRQELEDDFLTNCSIIESDEYGKFVQLVGEHMFFIKFSNDGKIVDYNRFFNYPIHEDLSLNLGKENLDSKFEIVKNFLDDYSPRII